MFYEYTLLEETHLKLMDTENSKINVWINTN